jgi:hypothetical protein
MGTRGRWVIGGAALVLVAACAFYIIDLLGREWVWRFTAEAGTCCTPKGAGQQSCREAIQKLKWAAWTFGDTARAADEKRRACEQMIASPPPPKRSDVAILAEHLDEDAGHPYDLGGPCTSGQGDSSDLYQAHTAALIDSNWPGSSSSTGRSCATNAPTTGAGPPWPITSSTWASWARSCRS